MFTKAPLALWPPKVFLVSCQLGWAGLGRLWVVGIHSAVRRWVLIG